MNKFLVLVVIFTLSCKSSNINVLNSDSNSSSAKSESNKISKLKDWYLKSYSKDSLPGINLELVYQDLLNNKKSKEIIIAFIDTSVDLNHEDFKDIFWTNINEIPNNNIDDDVNGYVDDIHGWNFMGNSKGENSIYENYEFVRVVRYYQNIFGEKTIEEITSDSLKLKLKEYTEAKITLDEKVTQRNEYFISDSTYMVDLSKAIKKLATIIPRSEMTVKNLDSIGKLKPDLLKEIEILNWAVRYNYSEEESISDVDLHRRYRDIYYNIAYNEREIMNDDPDNVNDKKYGNSQIDNNIDKLAHATSMIGVAAANRNNNKGIQGIVENIKVMPIVAAGYGQAHDKDLALAIRYAVDNGASIINLSIIKKFSVHKEWVFDAIKYAEQNDVLIVGAAGNDNENLDVARNFYPNDNDYNGKEISNNFIMIGGSSYKVDKNLKASFSNYGAENVDIFAPSDSIYTTTISNNYKFVEGTSIAAPIVTGIAGLIRSYFPSLKAHEVKQILMDSGTKYDVKVNISNTKEEKFVPFSSLSKSGKIVNAYKAFLMADELNKNK